MKKFVIITSQRTGSIFLRVWLNHHPQIRSHGEIFNYTHPGEDSFRYFCRKRFDWELLTRISYVKPFYRLGLPLTPPKAIDSYFKEFYSPNGPAPWVMNGVDEIPKLDDLNKQMVGFKIMYAQLKPLPSLMRRFKEDGYWVIHLIRRNHLKQFVSISRLHADKISCSVSQPDKRTPIYVNPGKLMAFCHKINKEVTRHRETLSTHVHRYKEVFYEDFFSDMDAHRNMILDFLELHNSPLGKTGLKKMSSGDITKEIENYEEIIELLNGSPYASFLDDYHLP